MGVKHCLVDINQLMLSCFLNLNTGFKLCSFDSCSYLLKKLQHSAILQKVFSFEKPRTKVYSTYIVVEHEYIVVEHERFTTYAVKQVYSTR